MALAENTNMTMTDVLRSYAPSVRVRSAGNFVGMPVCVELRSVRATFRNDCLSPAVYLDGVPITRFGLRASNALQSDEITQRLIDEKKSLASMVGGVSGVFGLLALVAVAIALSLVAHTPGAAVESFVARSSIVEIVRETYRLAAEQYEPRAKVALDPGLWCVRLPGGVAEAIEAVSWAQRFVAEARDRDAAGLS